MKKNTPKKSIICRHKQSEEGDVRLGSACDASLVNILHVGLSYVIRFYPVILDLILFTQNSSKAV